MSRNISNDGGLRVLGTLFANNRERQKLLDRIADGDTSALATLTHLDKLYPPPTASTPTVCAENPPQHNFWSTIDTSPKDGTVFWAYLNQSGIRRVRWVTGEQLAELTGDLADECIGWFIQDDDPDELWSPKWWCPLMYIPTPSE